MADSSSVRLDYVSAGCNRVVGALDWGEGGLIAYCAHHAIAIYNPATSSIISTLLGHTDTVTCLRWFKASDFGVESNTRSVAADQPHTFALASGGGNGSICIWLLTLENPNQPWTLSATLPAHKAAVTSITIHNAGSPGQIVLVTTAGDGEVSVWSTSRPIDNPASLLPSEENWHLAQRLRYDTKLQHCSAITSLPFEPKSLLLALGGVDGKVRLLLSSTSQENNSTTTTTTSRDSNFKPICELAGHQNWVRGLAFTRLKADGLNKILLASASQDRYIRLWAIIPGALSASSNTGINTTDDSTIKKSDTSPTSLAASLMKFAPRPRFSSPSSGAVYQVSLEALLIGHEDWVHSVAWRPRKDDESDDDDDAPCLLSASMDRTMALWVPDKATGEFTASIKIQFICCYFFFFAAFFFFFGCL